MEYQTLLKKINFKNYLSLNQKRTVIAYIFCLPFIIGFMLFFLYPFIQSVIFSLNELQITKTGYELDFVGIENYYKAIMVHPEYTRILTETILQTLADLPAIIIFSFFAASILNQNFRGRTVARMMFFLPVILTSGALARMEQQDYMHQLAGQGGGEEFSLLGGVVEEILIDLRLPDLMLNYIATAIDYIPEIINGAGIPILIFLAGLQSIPPSLYEAAKVEGSTSWDNFWKITFPMVSPLILTNIVFIIVDSFTSPDNEVIQLILDGTWGSLGYGQSTAMAWMYFIGIAIILAVVIKILSKRVFYQE
ncbi:MAG: carbohydrate ABC transporter permease [Halanaerobiaceae bacterium]